MKYAWIENGRVRDVCPGNPTVCYHPTVAAHYTTEVPDNIVRGAMLVEGTWTNPEAQEGGGTTEPQIQVSPVEFKLLWTSAERVAIATLKQTDPVVADLYDIIDDPRLTCVKLYLKSTQDAVDYLLAKLAEGNTITADVVATRRAEILSGRFL